MTVWGKHNGPWIQAYTLVYAVGCMLAPLTVEPFLLKPEEPNLTNYSSSNTSEHSECHLVNGLEECTANVTAEKRTDGSKLIYAFVIPCVLKLLTFAFSLVIFGIEGRKILSKSRKDNMESKKQNFTTATRAAYLLLLFSLTFSSAGIEVSMGGFLMAFSVKYLKWSKLQGAAVTFVFVGTFTFGSALGILIIRKLHPTTLLLIDWSICIVFSAILAAFITVNDSVLWVCAAGIGLGISSVFASMLSWTEKQTGGNVKMSTVLFVGIGVGNIVTPSILGALMDKVSHISLVFVVLYFALSGTALLISLIKLTQRLKGASLSSHT